MSDTNETSADIIAEMRKLGELDGKSTDKIPRSLMGLGLRAYADRLEAAAKRERADGIRSEYDTFRREALKVIDEIASNKTCMHCDMHEACAHGEDGMPTACNEFLKARAFREKYRVEETRSDDCPF